jgi:uncharacterized damage-inducible protein DinB
MKKQKQKPTSKAKKLNHKKVAKATSKKKAVKQATTVKAAKKTVNQTPSKKIVNMLLKEMEQEATTTRKMLQRIPEDKYDWQPHPRSMTIKRLATHIAEIPGWVNMAINTDELNFSAGNYVPRFAKNNAELMEILEKSLATGKASLENANDDLLSLPWVMRNGDTIINRMTKGEMIHVAYSQLIHHRAQLGVFLRLLDVPIPGSYGPSADEPSFL